ncbi:Flp pilus assembly protein CpaB [Brevundimonas mediterranea]|uniref:Pilus assembly protein CpaB n=1 Tax=Brevundimonas mediterranea TaxID=74329 RepID=A0A7W6F028_9CAUL|nr:Flp pilus assembly protein CpaB [Brevundimonas mediterranea]MBB3872484.1 pilus assembly protein CpaB [Brevundimonas mediterranea]
MKPARIAVICIAAVSALGLALVVRAMGNGEPAAPAAAAPVETRPMAKILVAAKNLEPGKRLAESDLAWKDWPVDEVNPAFITDGSTPIPAKPAPEGAGEKAGAAVERVAEAAGQMAGPGAKSDYIGSVVREPILAGEPIVGRKIVRAGDSGYLAAYLEPGMRAMAIAVTVESAAGGFILPGDRVDVVLTVQNEGGSSAVEGGGVTAKYSSATVMQNVKVLAIDQSTRAGDDAQAVVGATATLEVRPQDAVLLAQAKSEGELSLSLRSYADTAGPSGATRAPRAVASASRSVRVYRGGEPEVVNTP